MMSVRAALLCSALTLAGCVTGPTFDQAKESDLIVANYAAADRLIRGSQLPLSKDAPIIMATLVRLESLNESSNLGRLVSQHIAARFTQLGYRVPELKLRGTIFMRANQGELLLSRDVQDVSKTYQAQAVMVGTYALAGNFVHMNISLVDASNGQTLSALDYRLPMVAEITALLPAK